MSGERIADAVVGIIAVVTLTIVFFMYPSYTTTMLIAAVAIAIGYYLIKEVVKKILMHNHKFGF